MKILLVAVLIAYISAGDAAPAEAEVKEAQFFWPGMGMGFGGFPGYNGWNMDQGYNMQPMKAEEFPIDYSASCSNSCQCVQICVRWWPCDCSCPPPCPPATTEEVTTPSTTTSTTEKTTTTTTPSVEKPDTTTPGSDCPTCCRPCMPCMIWWMCRPCNNGCETTTPEVEAPPTPPETTTKETTTPTTTTTTVTTTTTTAAPCVPCRPVCPPCMIWWMCQPCVRNPCNNGCEDKPVADEPNDPAPWDVNKKYPEQKYPEDWNKNYYRQF